MERLYLGHNQLSGSIPPELGNLSELLGMILFVNRLSGPIPPELGNLSRLRILSLSDNQLSGSIPVELGKLDLSMLTLAGNRLTGCLPYLAVDPDDVGLQRCEPERANDRQVLKALYNATNGET